MRWNPFLNAACATGYIGGIALLLQFISSLRHDTSDNLLGSMGALSLLVLSAAVMGFLFFYYPVVLLVENKRSEAASYFLKTLGTFGVITTLVLAVMLSV